MNVLAFGPPERYIPSIRRHYVGQAAAASPEPSASSESKLLGEGLYPRCDSYTTGALVDVVCQLRTRLLRMWPTLRVSVQLSGVPGKAQPLEGRTPPHRPHAPGGYWRCVGAGRRDTGGLDKMYGSRTAVSKHPPTCNLAHANSQAGSGGVRWCSRLGCLW
jgi:hypothetical protein